MKKLAVLLIAASVLHSANAATLRYKGAGDWFSDITIDGTGWFNPTVGQGTAVTPGASDIVRANWGGAVIELAQETTVGTFQLGVDEAGTFHIKSGGILHTAIGDNKIGNNGACTGTMIIDAGGVVNSAGWLMIAGNSTVTGVAEVSGTLNAAGHLWMATGSGATASLTINAGGIVNVGGMIGLGTVNALTASGGTASVTVNDGGLLALTNLHGLGSSVFPGSMFYLNGDGKITLPGDFTGVMNSIYIPTYVTGNGTLGNAVAELVEGNTVVTAIPEPATMSLLGLGVLALLRKRK